jgi:hypothetical protein
VKTFSALVAALVALTASTPALALTTADLGSNHVVKVLTQHAYLPGIPVLVRVEVRDDSGKPDRRLWDAEATLSANNTVVLSTNKVRLRNGLGSVLVAFTEGGDFNLVTTVGLLAATNQLVSATNVPPTFVGGTLNADTTWSGIIIVTNHITNNFVLTIAPNTLVLIDGATSGTTNRLVINGSIQSLGTEFDPVTITCNNTNLSYRWGQIRHNNAQPSLYRYTSITRAGRATGEGHTGTAPIIRPTGSTIRFEYCNITDHVETRSNVAGFGTPGKIGMSSGSNLSFSDCLFQRARMGPEVTSTAFACTNTWIMDMRGPDDADGTYIHTQSGGQVVIFTGCLIADGDDDGLDTLGSSITVENCILRDWKSLIEDAKAISVFGGATTVRRSLIVDSTVGIAAKWSSGSPTIVTILNSTLNGNLTNVYANKKSTALGPFIDFRITNSILWGTPTPVISDFGVTNFTIGYCTLSAPWPGTNNTIADPTFADVAAQDFRLQPFSPAIDAGDPTSPLDPDGSPADQGWLTFVPPAPSFGGANIAGPGAVVFQLNAYTNRNYVIDATTDFTGWTAIATNFQNAPVVSVTNNAIAPHQFLRARLAQ